MKGKTKVTVVDECLLDGSEKWMEGHTVYVTYPLKDELKIPGILPLTSSPTPKEIIFNPPATIVYWTDGTRTVVKCSEEDVFSEEVGFALCFVKKCMGNKHSCSTYIRKALKGAKRYGNKDNSIEFSDEEFEDLATVLNRLKTTVLSSLGHKEKEEPDLLKLLKNKEKEESDV